MVSRSITADDHDPRERSALARRVAYLCSDVCAGREAGSREGLAARRYIADEMRAAGLAPRQQPVPGCRGANVYARVAATGDRIVLVGAHYDHLGRAGGGEAYWGADDNAASVAVLLALADRFRNRPPPGEVLLVAFDGEEPPHFLTGEMGSVVFAADPPVELARIDLAVILDLVGHAVGPAAAPPSIRRSLFVLGGEKSRGTPDLVARVAAGVRGIVARPLDLDVVPPLSDYEPLRRAGVPVLFLTAGRWRHYHEVTDTPERLDYDKLTATVAFVDGLVRGRLGEGGEVRRYCPGQPSHGETARTLLAMARELSGVVAGASEAARILAEIEASAPRAGALSPDQWQIVRALAAALEGELA